MRIRTSFASSCSTTGSSSGAGADAVASRPTSCRGWNFPEAIMSNRLFGNVGPVLASVSRRGLAARLGGRWVRPVDTSDDVQQLHEVGDAAGHGTGGVPLVVESNHTGPGNQRPTCTQPNKGIVGGRIP